MLKLSVMIITLNEEKNILKVLSSIKDLAWEIIIVDSGSQDQTCQIAQSFGAKVFQKEFLGYGQQKNYALSLCSGDWVLSLDADEELSAPLQINLRKLLMNEHQPVQKKDSSILQPKLYQLNRLNFFKSKPIKHGGWYPDKVIRLFPRGSAHWSTPHVHEEVLPLQLNSKIELLEGELYHYTFPTFLSQVNTNLKYAKLGAQELIDRKGRRPYLIEVIIRPLVKFFECYFLKCGFKDGVFGFLIAINATYSMFLKYSLSYLSEEN
jgi:(heptosyl)LPS beta-1,4-glucosyltransferase